MAKQIVSVAIYKESGCDITQEEYSISLVGVIGGLDFDEKGGESDYHLIKNAVEEWISCEHKSFDHGIDAEYEITVTMTERCEQEELYFNKWFEVDSFEFTARL